MSSRLRTAPNPANDVHNISFSQSENCQVTSIALCDWSGKIIAKQPCEHPDTGEIAEHFDVASFVPGVYVLRVVTSNGIVSQKVIIAHD